MTLRSNGAAPHHALDNSEPAEADKATLHARQKQVVCSESQTKAPQIAETRPEHRR
jgi:hypothetical protein